MYAVSANGVLKKIETWQVIIPRHDNDGVPFEDSVIESILDHITLTFPGLTMVNCKGRWRGEERVHVDDNVQVLIDALPLSTEESASFFVNLKAELQSPLRQEKIYITKESSKEEMISLDEFFEEVGVELDVLGDEQNKIRLAQQMVGRIDFVMQRMGYETLAIRRDRSSRKIIWERKLCGIRLVSELDDSYPDDATIFAADQLEHVTRHLFAENCIVLGHYEFQHYAVDRLRIRPLVRSTINVTSDLQMTGYLGPDGREKLTVRQFVERFTMAVVANLMVLRDHGFRPNEIRINVGRDGSMQVTQSELGNYLFYVPAPIPDKNVQLEIIRCINECCAMLENGTLDPLSVLQAKAMNQYIMKRAFLRRSPPEPNGAK